MELDTCNYTVTRPTAGTVLQRFLPNGVQDTTTVDQNGILLQNEQGLFSYFDTALNRGVLIVANYTNDNASLANIPNQSSLALICFRQDNINSSPYTMNLKWIPGSILVPIQRIPADSTFLRVIYDSITGRCSWLDDRYLTRIQDLENGVSNVSTELHTAETDIDNIENALSNKIDTINDITTNTKYVDFFNQSKCINHKCYSIK